MKSLQHMIFVSGLLILVSPPAFAGTNDPGIQQGELNQQQRTDQGVQSGRLTPREAGRLEAWQSRIQQNEAWMKVDGNLTAGERCRLNREQNRANRTIFRKKYNMKGVKTR
jgi:hypothetical protein